jgi:hypothetical protein
MSVIMIVILLAGLAITSSVWAARLQATNVCFFFPLDINCMCSLRVPSVNQFVCLSPLPFPINTKFALSEYYNGAAISFQK